MTKPLNWDGWNFRFTIDHGFYELPYGWRRVNIGIFCLKCNIPHGADAYFYVAKGFWFRFAYWLPFVFG